MILLSNTKLESLRLSIIPLTYEQLLDYRRFDSSLESQLGLLQSRRELSEELLLTLDKFVIPYILENPEHILYGTLWVIIANKERRIVGDIGFKGAPSDKGLVEIGYGTYPAFFNKGFMTEAVDTITRWAFQQPEIKIILAETDKNNAPSQKVLIKNNFTPFAETECMYWWRLDKESEDSNYQEN